LKSILYGLMEDHFSFIKHLASMLGGEHPMIRIIDKESGHLINAANEVMCQAMVILREDENTVEVNMENLQEADHSVTSKANQYPDTHVGVAGQTGAATSHGGIPTTIAGDPNTTNSAQHAEDPNTTNSAQHAEDISNISTQPAADTSKADQYPDNHVAEAGQSRAGAPGAATTHGGIQTKHPVEDNSHDTEQNSHSVPASRLLERLLARASSLHDKIDSLSATASGRAGPRTSQMQLEQGSAGSKTAEQSGDGDRNHASNQTAGHSNNQTVQITWAFFNVNHISLCPVFLFGTFRAL
jgi:hypothetical protein